MTTLEIKGDWNITKGKLKQKWASLTDDDLQYIEGKQEELLGRIQKRTGETREAIEKIISGSCCGSSHQPTDEARKPDEKAAGGCCSSDHTHTHTHRRHSQSKRYGCGYVPQSPGHSPCDCRPTDQELDQPFPQFKQTRYTTGRYESVGQSFALLSKIKHHER